MTTAHMSVSRHVAPVLLALSAVLAAANWYFTPGRFRSWMTALAVLAVMGAILWIGRRYASTIAAQRAADSLRGGIVAGAAILVVSLGIKLAEALGVLDPSNAPQRLTMVILGVFFMVTGNAIPKTLTPLSAMQCDSAKTQAAQRFTGWALVLSGLAFAMAWLVLPLDLATPVSVTAIFIATLAIIVQAVRLGRVTRSR